MTRLLYNHSNAQLLPYPRQDDQPVIGLDPTLVALTLIEQAPPSYDPATHRLEPTEAIDLQAGTVTRGWRAVPLPPAPPAPNWMQFYEVISTNPDVNTMLGHVLAAAPALYGGLIVGLSRVSDGDTQLFLAAWSGVRALMPLQAEFVASLQAVATTHHLPPDFIEALA